MRHKGLLLLVGSRILSSGKNWTQKNPAIMAGFVDFIDENIVQIRDGVRAQILEP